MYSCVEDAGAHKPDPGPYLAVLGVLTIPPHEAVAFEDSPHGIAATNAAGMLCVAVPNARKSLLGKVVIGGRLPASRGIRRTLAFADRGYDTIRRGFFGARETTGRSRCACFFLRSLTMALRS